MGWRYLLFRVSFVVRKRIGLLKMTFPVEPEFKRFITLNNWKKQEQKVFLISREKMKIPLDPSAILKKRAEKILAGKIPFFSSTEFDLGKDYDWITNPDTGYKYDVNLHWSEIKDFSNLGGDIKFVWEKSRFNYIYTIIRYDYHFQKDLSAFVFDEINHWIDSNPINCGPNYKCSQEISLRVFNWLFAINYYENSAVLTDAVFQKIMHSIYWQVKHVYRNINFSRIAVRNNHAITETLGLYLFGMMLPFFPEANKWKKKGKEWFQREVAYQVYPDGTYLQFSMNYHRVVVQLFGWAFSIAEMMGEKFDSVVYDRAYASLKFLRTCQDEATGWLPNYGSNDGALFFPFSTCDYRDFRPQLNTLHLLLAGRHLYADGPWREDACWLGAKAISAISFPPLSINEGWHIFKEGGYAILKEEETTTFIRCGNHKDRPAHADNLHIDIWHKGKNVLFDAGSYKYNCSPEISRYFMGTESHNTVKLKGFDQMLKGGRFIWYFWSQAIRFTADETAESYVFNGAIKAFGHVSKGIVHKRTVSKNKNRLEWIITDEVSGKPKGLEIEQLWHCLPGTVSIEAKDGKGTALQLANCEGWVSNYYSSKEPTTFNKVATGSTRVETTMSI